ncbi:MAG: TonB-dependent receptor domain-containing protein [Marinifilaceae bacterium]
MKKILLICILLMGIKGYAQTIEIRLSDKQSDTPIAFAHFLYDTQKGVATPKGIIRINFIENAKLILSHVNYGKVEVPYEKLRIAIHTGILKLPQTHISLLPSTVIARRNSKAESQTIQVSSNDKLSHDAGDFLSQSAGINGIRKSGSYGFDPVLRGFKYDQINIVMDNGVSATAACPNRMDPPISQVPLNMVDKVEIVKGPHSLRFGNAFGGTLHFKSSTTTFSKTAKAIGRTTGSYESNGKIYRTEALAGIKGNFYNFGVFGAYSQGNDYEDGNGTRVASGFNRRNVGLSSLFKLSKTQNIKLSANNNFAEDVDFPALNMDLREDDTWLVTLDHKINFQEKKLASITTSAFGSFVDHEMDNLGKDLNPRKVNAVTKAETKNYGARSEAIFQLGESTLFAGIDFKREEAEGIRTRNFLMGQMQGKTIFDNIWQDSYMEKSSLFGEYHFPIDELYFVASARLEYNRAKSRDKAEKFLLANPSDPSDHLNTSMSLGLTKDLSKQVRMGLWLGRAERSGSLTERFINHIPVGRDPFERIGNTDLDSEVNYQIDYNFSWRLEKSELSINVFASFLRDYISASIREDLSPLMPTAPGVKQYINIDKAEMRGFEVSWQQELASNLYHRADMAFTYGKNKELNQPLPEIPPLDFRYSLGGNFFQHKFHTELSLRHVLEQNRIATDFGESKTPDFTVLDLNASYFPTENISLSGGIRNLFDEAYYEHLNRAVKGSSPLPIFAPGRSFYITIALEFL